MSRANTAIVKRVDGAAPEAPKSPAPLRVAEPALPGLATARVTRIEGDAVTVEIGGRVAVAERDPSVHPVVLRGACDRGERVLCERRDGGGWVVLGALRAQPTPGIDAATDYTIEADHVVIRARHDVTLTTEAAGLVLRAIGEVETYAERILSRAEGVHKIVGRMLKLN